MEKDANKQYYDEVKKEQDFYGFTESKPLLVDEELLLLSQDVFHDPEILSSLYDIHEIASEKFVRKSILLWEMLGIKLHEIETFDDNVSASELINGNTSSCITKMVDPSGIPIVFDQSIGLNQKVGCVIQAMGTDGLNDQIKRVIFHSIWLTKLDNYLTSCNYNHEIAHTQINSVFGSCKSKLNHEVISALTEEIFACNIDPSLDTTRKHRKLCLLALSKIINNLYHDDLSYSEKMNISMYIQSYLEGFNLANIYLQGNPNIRDEMQSFINNIFNGNSSVEDMLYFYDSEYKDVPKKLELIKSPIQ